MYTEAERDRLAEQSAETLCFRPGAIADYDVEHYSRIPRKLVPFGTHRYYDIPKGPFPTPLDIPTTCLSPRIFLNRLGGFRRNALFTADGIGSVLRDSGIGFTDGPGNGLFESLRICKKYGVHPVYEGPAMGFSLPFLEEDLSSFRSFYRGKLEKMHRDLGLVETILGSELIHRKDQPWVLWLRYSPLALYFDSLEKDPDGTTAELERQAGIQKAPVEPGGPVGRAALARFWEFLRRRHAEVLGVMSEEFRDIIVGDGLIVGNMHANPIVDYGKMNGILDLPGVAVRPGYLEDASLHSAYVAFTVQLFRDLMGKPPIVSVRTNLLSSGLRFIPGPNLVRQWYGIAIRSGAAGFYFWPRDYPCAEDGYDGPMCGNPDPSTRGKERWNTHCRALADLANRRIFLPPRGDVAILVSVKGLDRDGWLRVFNAYRRFHDERLHVRFVDIEDPLESWSDAKLAVIPTLPLCSHEGLGSIRKYTGSGSVAIVGEEPIGTFDFQGQKSDAGFQYQNIQTWAERETPSAGNLLWLWNDLTAESNDESKILRRVCLDCSVDPMDWIHKIDLDSYHIGVEPSENPESLEPDPAITFEHYQYEHSSDWALPQYQEREEESFR